MCPQICIESLDISSGLVLPQDPSQLKIALHILGRSMIVRAVEDLTYIGAAHGRSIEGISIVKQELEVTTSAFIRQNRPRDKDQSPGYQLCILLFGSLDNADSVGRMLFEHGHCLQQPGINLVDVAYYNPQYLIRPGKTFNLMPEATVLPVQDVKRGDFKDAQMKNEVLEIFDTAYGPPVMNSVRVSWRLRTALKPYDEAFLIY